MRRLKLDLKLSKEDEYRSIRNSSCRLCKLHSTAEHVCLIGRGKLDADLFFIGEAPGHREDDIGKPFAGMSGKLLDDILGELDILRSEVYISNVVHCRPPSNRTPSTTEANKCKIYLNRELNLVKPKVIIPMGNIALKAITGKTGITKARGKVLEYDSGTFKALVLPTFHPAAILRNPGNMDYLVDDIVKAVGLLGKGVNYGSCKYKILSTVSAVRHLISNITQKGYCSTDVEANTLKWWSEEAKVAGISFSIKSGVGYFIPIDHKDSPFTDEEKSIILDELNEGVFSNFNVKKIGQNIKYDMHMLSNYGMIFNGNIYDTMFMHFLLDENRPHDLDSISTEITNYGPYWEDVDRLGLKQGKALEIPLDILGKYGSTDAAVTLMAFFKYRKLLKADKGLWNVFVYIQLPLLKAMFDAEERGMLIDYDRLDNLKEEFKYEKERIILELESFPEVENTRLAILKDRLEKKKSAKLDKFNFGSTQQVQRLLFHFVDNNTGIEYNYGFGAKPIKLTEKESPSTDEETLIELIHRKGRVGKFARMLLAYRKVIKLDSQYVSGLYKHIDKDSRVHPNFRIIGTKTGRMSCKDPNLQQIPRSNPAEYDSELKSSVKTVYVPTPGYVYLSVDLSQAELRIMAHMAKETRMIEWFNNGLDIHSSTAAEMLGIPLEDFLKLPDASAKRKRAKTVNFGVIYEVGKYTLAKSLSSPSLGIYFSPDESAKFQKDYFKRFPKVYKYILRQHRILEKQGYVNTLFGMKRRLPEINSDSDMLRKEAYRQATNSPIQGTSAQYALFGLVYAMGYVDGKNRIKHECYLVNQVHDELIVEVPEKDVVDVANTFIKIYKELPTYKYFGFKINVPMIADAKMSKDSWATLEKIK